MVLAQSICSCRSVGAAKGFAKLDGSKLGMPTVSPSAATKSTPQPNVTGAEISAKLWLLLLVTGIGAGMASGLLMKLLRAVQHATYSYSSGDFLSGVQGISGERRVMALCLAGLLAGSVLFTLRRVTGRGGPDLSDAVWCKSGELPTVSTLLRAVLSIVIVGMGAALGRESALKQTGGVIASRLSHWGKLSREEQHLLVACGVGAGMAAAYNVPLGGALFAVEVLLGTMALPVTLAALTASFTATATSWLLLPDAATYSAPSVAISSSLMVWAALLGPIAGLASVVYIRGVRWATWHKPKGWHLLVVPMLILTALGATAIPFPQLLGNGKEIVQLAFLNQVDIGLLAWLVLLRPLATVFCLRSGVPGGLFTPTMSFGAVLGGLLGQGWTAVWPGPTMGSYAILASGAVLAATTQGPVSSVVFILELTQHVDAMMVPLLVAVAGATITSRLLEPQSIYSAPLTKPAPPSP